MGDPRRTRSKFDGPRHPWNKERIETESVLMKTYGLTNKKELWKVESKLKSFKDNIKRLIAQQDAQAEKERKQIFDRLQKLGLIEMGASADDILSLRVEQLLDRRLQTVVHNKELARSPKQARQFIVHGHVMIGDNRVTSPGYIVTVAEESKISFKQSSGLAQPDHPERVQAKSAPGAHSKTEVKSAKLSAEEEAPVTKTAEKPESKKPLEVQIEDETANMKEVVDAVETAEADNLEKDHATAIQDAAKEEKSPKVKKESKEEKKDE